MPPSSPPQSTPLAAAPAAAPAPTGSGNTPERRGRTSASPQSAASSAQNRTYRSASPSRRLGSPDRSRNPHRRDSAERDLPGAAAARCSPAAATASSRTRFRANECPPPCGRTGTCLSRTLRRSTAHT